MRLRRRRMRLKTLAPADGRLQSPHRLETPPPSPDTPWKAPPTRLQEQINSKTTTVAVKRHKSSAKRSNISKHQRKQPKIYNDPANKRQPTLLQSPSTSAFRPYRRNSDPFLYSPDPDQQKELPVTSELVEAAPAAPGSFDDLLLPQEAVQDDFTKTIQSFPSPPLHASKSITTTTIDR